MSAAIAFALPLSLSTVTTTLAATGTTAAAADSITPVRWVLDFGSAAAGDADRPEVAAASSDDIASRATAGRIDLATDRVFPSRALNRGYGLVDVNVGGRLPLASQLRWHLSAALARTRSQQQARFPVPSPQDEFAGSARLGLDARTGILGLRDRVRVSANAGTTTEQSRDYANSWRFNLAGLAATRSNRRALEFRVDHELDPSTRYTLSYRGEDNSLIHAPRHPADPDSGLGDALSALGLWDQYRYRAEDWVLNNPEGLSPEQAVLQLHRSYRLGPDSSRIYAHPHGANFAAPTHASGYGYGIPGLFVTSGDEEYWRFEQDDRQQLRLDINRKLGSRGIAELGVMETGHHFEAYENTLPSERIPVWDAYSYDPSSMAAYANLRTQLGALDISAGLRVDRLYSGLLHRAFPESLGARPEIADSMLPVPALDQFSPRVTLAMPVGTGTSFRVGRAVFYELHDLHDVYHGSAGRSWG